MIENSGLVCSARALEATITPAMIRAGMDRLAELLEAGTGSAYVVSEVFLAMERARAALASP
jgi:hypothetical protein